MSLDNFLHTVPDGKNSSFLNKEGIVSLEESVGRSGFVNDNGIDHGDFLAISGLGFSRGSLKNLNVNIVSATSSGQALDLNEMRCSQSGLFSHLNNNARIVESMIPIK